MASGMVAPGLLMHIFDAGWNSWIGIESPAMIIFAQLGERPTILDSHSDKVFKRILLTKARRKDVQKSSDISVYNTINREEDRGI